MSTKPRIGWRVRQWGREHNQIKKLWQHGMETKRAKEDVFFGKHTGLKKAWRASQWVGATIIAPEYALAGAGRAAAALRGARGLKRARAVKYGRHIGRASTKKELQSGGIWFDPTKRPGAHWVDKRRRPRKWRRGYRRRRTYKKLTGHYD